MSLARLPWPEARSILRLAVPIALTQIGMVLYGTVDLLFVGRLGAARSRRSASAPRRWPRTSSR